MGQNSWFSQKLQKIVYNCNTFKVIYNDCFLLGKTLFKKKVLCDRYRIILETFSFICLTNSHTKIAKSGLLNITASPVREICLSLCSLVLLARTYSKLFFII